MSLEWGYPLGLAMLASAGVIAWLHSRRRPGRVVVVPSIEPWLPLLGPEARRRRQVPPTVLLALHVVAAVLLALACADPRQEGDRAASQGVIALDTTTSMGADHRWSAALRAVGDLAGQGGRSWSLLALGPSPRLVLRGSSDPEVVLRAARMIRPGGHRIDWDAAWRLIESVAGGPAHAHVVTDGGQARPEWSGRVQGWWVVGRPEANVAVVEARARSLGSQSSLYARLANFGPEPIEVPVRLIVDGSERDRRTVRLDPGAAHETVWRVPAGGWAEVRLSGQDALAADDYAVVPLAGVGTRAQLVGLSETVARAVGAIEGLESRRAGPAELRLDGSVDVTVAERFDPAAITSGGVVLFAPRGEGTAGGKGEGQSLMVDAVADHPIGQGLDLLGTSVSGVPAGADRASPPWALPVIEAGGRVVAYAGVRDGGRMVVFDFDASSSQIATTRAFPVLVGRAVAWAARAGRPEVGMVGDVLDLGNLPARVVGPESVNDLPRGGQIALVSPGRYEITVGSGRSAPVRRLGIRAGHQGESDLRTVDAGTADTTAAPGAVLPGGPGRWLALLGLAALGLEGAWRARTGNRPR